MATNETIERIVYEGVDKITAVTKQAANSQRALAQSIEGVKSALAAVGVTVGAGAMVALFMETVKATAALDDMAESTGASVEGLSAIQRVAKVSGADFEGLTGQIGKMIKGLREGGDEGGKTARALDFLGVKAKEADGRFRDTSQVLIEVSKQLALYEDGGNKVALVQDILGKGAERYIPLLKDIAEGTDLVSKHTTRQAAEAERLQKNLDRATAEMSDTWVMLVTRLTPALLKFTEQTIDANNAVEMFFSGLEPVARRGSQADVRRVENALEPPKKLTFQSTDEKAAGRDKVDKTPLPPWANRSTSSIRTLRSSRRSTRTVSRPRRLRSPRSCRPSSTSTIRTRSRRSSRGSGSRSGTRPVAFEELWRPCASRC